MSTETDTTIVVNDELPHLAVTVEGHTIAGGAPTALPTELAERLIGDGVGWRRAGVAAAANETTSGDQPAPSPYDGLPLDQLRGRLTELGIKHEGRLNRATAIELLTAYDLAAADTSATD